MPVEVNVAHEDQVKEYGRQNVPRPGNPAYNEAWALIESARRIGGVVQYGDFTDAADRRKMRDAIRLNLRIWTIIQAEQTAGDNQLPDPIRQNILTLCKFIDKHSVDAMVEPTPEKAAVLININRNIAAGLLGSTTDEIDTAEREAPEKEAGSDQQSASNDKPAEPLKINI
jgi:flagellar protein FlaF